MKTISRKEAKAAGLKCYFTGGPCPHGHVAERLVSTCACVVCNRAHSAAWRAAHPDECRAHSAAWRAENPDKVREHSATWRAAHPDEKRAHSAAWRAAHPDEKRDGDAAYRARNRDELRAYGAAWAKANPGKRRAIKAKRRARKLQATPSWSNLKWIEIIYDEAQARGLTVDHIVPLQHPLVCGLHCPANLQLLTKSDNCRKGNRYVV